MGLNLKTFNELYQLGVSAITNATQLINYFGDGSKIRAVLESSTHMAEFIQTNMTRLYDARIPRYAKGIDLSGLVSILNMTPKVATYSTGIITFYVTGGATETFILSSGSVVGTQPILDGTTINFTLDRDITFTSGATSATGSVTCTQTGTIGNVASGLITNNISSIPGIDSLTNLESFGSGRDNESDAELVARIPLTLNGLKCGVRDSILERALSVDEVTYAKLVDNSPQTGMFTLYITTSNGIVSQATKDAVSGQVLTKANFCIPFTISSPSVLSALVTMTVTKLYKDIDENTLRDNIRSQLTGFVNVSTLNELNIDDIIVQTKLVNGVKKVSSVTVNGSSNDLVSSTYEIVRIVNPTDITITFLDP